MLALFSALLSSFFWALSWALSLLSSLSWQRDVTECWVLKMTKMTGPDMSRRMSFTGLDQRSSCGIHTYCQDCAKIYHWPNLTADFLGENYFFLWFYYLLPVSDTLLICDLRSSFNFYPLLFYCKFPRLLVEVFIWLELWFTSSEI